MRSVTTTTASDHQKSLAYERCRQRWLFSMFCVVLTGVGASGRPGVAGKGLTDRGPIHQSRTDASTSAENMNGPYRISPTPGASMEQPEWVSSYSRYPNGTQYFDAYSAPFETLYSQVWWAGLPPQPLPEAVVRQFENGKVMAVVGFEVDQVIVDGAEDGSDLSVPITAAYNHHFDGFLNNGRKSNLVKLKAGDHRISEFANGHHAATGPYIPVEHTPGVGGVPTSLRLGGGNGGEYRKTFHGYAPGFVQIIESPTEIQVTPMQIDTWHRDKMNLSGSSPFVSGPVPRNSEAPISGPDAIYSGLLECPLTTRITKNIAADYDLLVESHCHNPIRTAAECTTAVSKALGENADIRVPTKIINDPNSAFPRGCSVSASLNGTLITSVFNSADTNGTCGSAVTKMSGKVESLINVTISFDLSADEANIILVGPADVWFGVGLGATEMRGTYALIVDGAGHVSERVLGDHLAGVLLPPSLTVLSTNLEDGSRKVVLRRPLRGLGAEYYTFSRNQTVLPIINAFGNGPTLGYHREKTVAKLTLLPVRTAGATGACVCVHQPPAFGLGQGEFVYTPVRKDPGERGQPTTLGFSNRCAPQPRGDLLAQQNPTCDVRAYTGGQSACHHMFSLLDADQPIPWADQPINYTLKWRFWYQEYDPRVHTTVQYSSLGKGTDWSIGAGPMSPGYGAEYDVPKCNNGVPGCTKEADGTWVHTITGIFAVTNGSEFAATEGKIFPVAAHLHCHAPTCLSMAVYVNSTGRLLCEETASYGKGYDSRFDEPGYIAVPPCLWGPAKYGLEEPPNIAGIVLKVVKRANATYGHHGEMAHGEIYYVETPAAP